MKWNNVDNVKSEDDLILDEIESRDIKLANQIWREIIENK